MESFDKAKKIVRIADSKKAKDIELIKIYDISSVSDYFIICSANSNTQIKSIADEIEFKLKNDDKIYPTHIEGYQTADWILMDYKDVVVHIFSRESRDFYNLEKLWSDATKIDIDDILTEN